MREQFGKPIGSFQAIKHMCAEMLLRSEQAAVAAGRRRRGRCRRRPDDQQLSIAAACRGRHRDRGAKANAKDCIQVLGGIGITWEHDAHLYLRRAYGIAQFLGGRSRWLRRVAALTQQGVRRDLHIDLDSVATPAARDRRRGSRSRGAARREASARARRGGLLAPHWPQPYGPGRRRPPSSC